MQAWGVPIDATMPTRLLLLMGAPPPWRSAAVKSNLGVDERDGRKDDIREQDSVEGQVPETGEEVVKGEPACLTAASERLVQQAFATQECTPGTAKLPGVPPRGIVRVPSGVWEDVVPVAVEATSPGPAPEG